MRRPAALGWRQAADVAPETVKNRPPEVSVLLVTFRRSPYLEGAVGSLLRQTFQDWELVVVDDSENRAAETCLARWSADPRVRYFHRPIGRSGYANALNYARAHSRADLLAILDDDDLWIEPRKLEMQVGYLRDHPSVRVCGSSAMIVDARDAEIGPAPVAQTDSAIRSCILFGNAFINVSTVFHKSIGTYSEDCLCPDWDLWLRAGKQGEFYNFPDQLCAYRKSSTNTYEPLTPRYAKDFRMILNRYRRDYPGYWKASAYHFAAREAPLFFGAFVRQRLPYLGRGIRRLLFPSKPQGAL